MRKDTCCLNQYYIKVIQRLPIILSLCKFFLTLFSSPSSMKKKSRGESSDGPVHATWAAEHRDGFSPSHHFRWDLIPTAGTELN